MGLRDAVNKFKAWREYGRLKKLWEGYRMNKGHEPVMLASVVRSAAVIAALLGYAEISEEQVESIVVVGGAAIVGFDILSSWLTRRKTVSVKELEEEGKVVS